MVVIVNRAENTSDIRMFVNLPYQAYRGETFWRPPLRIERNEHFDPKKNRALSRLQPTYFLAFRDGQPVGRIASFVNPKHVQHHGEDVGHFGFLDTGSADDNETVRVLLQAAEEDLRRKGMAKIAGPYNFSVNDECGLLVDGFESPPSVMMPYGRPDLPKLVEEAGYLKAMDLYAFRYQMGETFSTPPFVSRIKTRFESDPRITVRPLKMANLYDDIALIVRIFNDAWADNWGFLPISDEEATFLADSMKPVLQSHSLWIAFIDGEPASFTLMIPNLNEATRGLDGRLLPFGWATLLYRIKVAGVRSARIPLAGTHRKFHKTRRGMTATVGAWEACLSAQHAKGVREVEFSWVLETNKDLLGLADIYDCERYKTYRIYEKRSEMPPSESSYAVDTLVLAGARKSGDALAEAHHVPSKAHIKVAGKSMISRVLSALTQSHVQGRITVIGLDQHEDLQTREMWPEITHAPGADGPAASVYACVDKAQKRGAILVTTCDHALLTPAIINAFIEASLEAEADLTVALAPRAAIEARYPNVARTYLRFGDGAYSSCNLFCLVTPAAQRVVRFWQDAEKDRKRPWRIAWRFGVIAALRILVGRPSLPQVFAIVSRRLGVTIRPIVLPFAEAAIDVDTAADLALVERIVSERAS